LCFKFVNTFFFGGRGENIEVFYPFAITYDDAVKAKYSVEGIIFL